MTTIRTLRKGTHSTHKTWAVFFLGLFLCSGSAMPQAPEAKAWSVLVEGLEDKNQGKRAAAVHALGLMPNDIRARRAAEQALLDQSKEVRAAGAEALGFMEARESIPQLKEAINDKESVVVFAATAALFTLGDPAAYEVYYAVLLGEKKSGESLLDSQLKMLKDPKALTQLGVEQGLGFIPFGGISYGLFKSLRKDNVSPLRAAAAVKLATDPDPKSADALRKTTMDKNWMVRSAVVTAIARRGDPDLLDAVLPLLDDENDVVRFTAAATTLRLLARI